MGINNILTSQGLFIEGQSIVEAYPQFKDLAELINTFANTGFAFLPIFLGFSAAKAFGRKSVFRCLYWCTYDTFRFIKWL